MSPNRAVHSSQRLCDMTAVFLVNNGDGSGASDRDLAIVRLPHKVIQYDFFIRYRYSLYDMIQT